MCGEVSCVNDTVDKFHTVITESRSSIRYCTSFSVSVDVVSDGDVAMTDHCNIDNRMVITSPKEMSFFVFIFCCFLHFKCLGHE